MGMTNALTCYGTFITRAGLSLWRGAAVSSGPSDSVWEHCWLCGRRGLLACSEWEHKRVQFRETYKWGIGG